MFDLYIVVTPVLSLITFLTLINLKLTLKQPQFDDLKYYVSKIDHNKQRQIEKQSSSQSQQSKRYFIKTLFYLIKNFTFLDLILVRRARNKVPIFLSLSIELALIYLFGFSFYFSAVGTILNLIFLTVKLISQYQHGKSKCQKENQSKNQKLQLKNGRKLQILMSTLSLLLNMGLIWIFYKNFNNSLIMSSSVYFGITFAIDNFAIKPAILALISLPLSFSDHMNNFIDHENQIVQILHNQRILKKLKNPKEQLKNPQKIFISTSHTENTLQIEPYVNLDPHQNILQTIKPSKKVQLQKKTNVRKRPSKQYNGDNSSLSLFESHLPIKQKNLNIKNLSNLKSSQKNSYSSPKIKENIDELNNSSFLKKKTRIYTENLDFIDESKINYPHTQKMKSLQNQNPIINTNDKTPKSKKFLKEIKFTNSAKKTFENNNQDFYNESKSKKKDTCEIYSKTQEFKDENRSNRSNESNFYGSAGKTDLVKIYEDKFAEDLGQIDVNSPYRKRKPFQIKLDEVNSKSNQTRNNKKLSLDTSKNILQELNTSHFPDYLQKSYLQQSHEKKRRSFHQVSDLNMSRKSDAFSKFSNDSRISKSFKRTIRSKDPIVRQNDENRIPEFVIEDFTY